MLKINNPLLSIIVPVYNVERFLKECLTSLETSNDINYEVILIDDGSSDNSKKICEYFCQKNLNFRLISKKNEGLSATRNLGINLSIGKYITFIDSDDYVDFDILNDLLIFANNNDLDIMRGSYEKFWGFNKNKIKKNNVKNELKVYDNNLSYLESSLKENRYEIVSCTSLYKKELLIKNNFYFIESLFFEDHEFTFKVLLSSNCKIGESINKPYYFYRQREGSITKSVDSKKIVSFLEIIKIQKEYIENNLCEKKRKIAYRLMLITLDHCIQFCEYNLKLIEKNKLRDNLKKILTIKEFRNIFFIRDFKRKTKLVLFVFYPKLLSMVYKLK